MLKKDMELKFKKSLIFNEIHSMSLTHRAQGVVTALN